MTTTLRLAEILEKMGVSQSEAARKAGLSFQAVNHLCSGRAKAINLDTADRLAKALGISPGELFHYSRRGKA